MKDRVGGVEAWSRGLATSFWGHLNVYDIESTEDGLEANVKVWTVQDPKDAPTGTDQWCSMWDNKYQLRWSGAAWQIDSAKKNREPASCDADMLVEQLGPEQSGYVLDWAYRNYSDFDQ